MAQEFPPGATELLGPTTRRGFLHVMGASLALAGLTFAGCRWPTEKLAPYSRCPQDVHAGEPKRYATVQEVGGVAGGLLVTSFDGRPIKIEGNPSYPANQGAGSAIQQASVLELCDPKRSTSPIVRESDQRTAKTWEDFAGVAVPHFNRLKASGGPGLCMLSEATSSPSLALLRGEFLKAFPAAKWFAYEPLSHNNERAGLQLASGEALRAVKDLSQAEIIFALDSDLLRAHPDALRHARDFAMGRRADDGQMNRLYTAESALSLTGAAADHRLALATSSVGLLALELAQS